MLQFHALSGLTITHDGHEVGIGGPRQRRLLAMLLIHRNSVVSVDRLAEAVFAGEPTPAASTTLRSYVARMRRAVDGAGSGPMLVTQAPGYMLRLPDGCFDVARFEGLLGAGGKRMAKADPAAAVAALLEGLELWRGAAYAEFADEDWARPEAQRLGELRLVAHERLVDAELACGRAAEVIPQIESLARDQPLREAFRVQLMLALYRTGRQAEALQVARDYRHVLIEELGLDPSPLVTELEQRILTHDPTLMLAESPGLPLRGYRLEERLGTGRDGTVFAARLPGVERDFAIRVVREQLADCPDFVRSFDAHAERVAALRHPALVTIHDHWREPGAAYLVMRRMRGGTLSDRLQRGPLSLAGARAVAERIGGALVEAAEAGIAHGHVTADSVLFDEADNPYLSDFVLEPRVTDQAGSEDVHDFATLIRDCLGHPRGAVSDSLAPGLSTSGRPSIAELVPQLVAALAGGTPGGDGPVPNPYKGLRAFDEGDAADFFGRDALIEEVLTRLADVDLRGRLVLIVGGSGTGKSSVVRAGLLSRLRHGDAPGSEQWFITTMLPGEAPFEELAESLRRVAVSETAGLAGELAATTDGIDRVIRRLVPGDAQLLLVVDQLEELFTLATEQDQRGFLDGLMYAVSAPDSRLRVVAALRADFYDRPLAVHRFGAAVNEATVTITAMSPAEMEAAIVEPAERVGGRVERALVAELVSAVADEPAGLPSLQFTLYELAERSPVTSLTLAAYRQLGGVDGAIASRAESLFTSLGTSEQAAVRQMFERLVIVSLDGEPTRRRAGRTELVGSYDSVSDAIDRWASARLLTLDRHPQTRVPTVELAHEALLREWPRLRRWIEDDRQVLVVLGRLREAATSWAELDRDPDALYRGARLELALDASDDLPPLEREFLDAGRRKRDREQQEATDRIERQARDNRRLRLQLSVIAGALAVALVGGVIALDQRRDAVRERHVATARELSAAADANLDDDPELSMLLALAAITETRSSDGTVLREAEEALHRAVTASRLVLSVTGVGGGLDWSPTGTSFVTEGPENSGLIDIRDAVTGESIRSFHGHDIDINGVAFSGDGSMLATTGDDGAVRVWAPGTGEQILELIVEEGGMVVGPSFSPDGTRLAASWPHQGLVNVIDVATGVVIAGIAAESPWGTTFSPDGMRIAIGNAGGAATVVDITSGQEVLRLSEAEAITSVVWSPDGRWIAMSGNDATAWVVDATTGERHVTITGHTAPVVALDWSTDSTRVATASDDGTALITEVVDDGGRELLSFSVQESAGGLFGVAFSPDGERLLTGDLAVTVARIWDASTTGGAEWVNVADVPYNGVDWTPDGRGLVVGGAGGTVSISDIETGNRLATYGSASTSREDYAHVDLSDDGHLLATSVFGGAVVDVVDAATGEHRFAHFLDPGQSVSGLAWSRTAEFLAVVIEDGRNGQVVVVDRSGAVVARLSEKPGHRITSVSFSPDGRLLSTTREGVLRIDTADMPVTIWDWERGEVVRTLDTAAGLAAFDPTGTRIAAGHRVEGIVHLWNVQTGERVSTMTAGSQVGAIAFGPEGTSMATGHADGTVRLWNSATGVQQLRLDASRRLLRTVQFSPDGSRLLTVDDDGLARVLAIDLDDLIGVATDRLTRGLSDAECRQYLRLERCAAD